jgi:hypothetical protein
MAKKDKPKAPERAENRSHIRLNLMRVHPFLRKAFRPLKESELNSEEVFVELFPNDKAVDLYKLRAVYELQR